MLILANENISEENGESGMLPVLKAE